MNMRNTTFELQKFLDDLTAGARAGDKLPTIRELMRRFGLSQQAVQRIFQDMKARGVVASQIGRGTFFLSQGGKINEAVERSAPTLTGDTKSAASRSVLLLRRSISIFRGRVLIEKLHQRFVDAGHRVLEVSYSDPAHARAVLKGLPRFDACVIQSTFKSIPIELLAAIREKADVIAVDGVALLGADVEAVGTEWGEPLAEAVRKLLQRGHTKMAFAATSQPLLATQLGFRRCEYLQSSLSGVALQTLKVPMLPDEEYAQCLVSSLKACMDEDARLPFTALIAWGIEDGVRFRQMLQDVGVSIPDSLSVVLLGRTDLFNEHSGFFETIGCSVEDQVASLYQVIDHRWADSTRPYGVHMTPVTRRSGASVLSLVDLT
jgi:DNA-binding LacI/PurR family transcriptional regulator